MLALVQINPFPLAKGVNDRRRRRVWGKAGHDAAAQSPHRTNPVWPATFRLSILVKKRGLKPYWMIIFLENLKSWKIYGKFKYLLQKGKCVLCETKVICG